MEARPCLRPPHPPFPTQELLDRVAGMRFMYPTVLADASPPDVDAAAAVQAACGDGGLAVTAADLTALGWAVPGGAPVAGLADALDLSISVDGDDGGGACVAAPTPPPSSPAKRAKVETLPPPQMTVTQPASGDLVWVPLGAAWWPAEVVGAGGGKGDDTASTLTVTILALNTPLSVLASVFKGIEDAFESRAALAAGTAAGAQVRIVAGGCLRGVENS